MVDHKACSPYRVLAFLFLERVDLKRTFQDGRLRGGSHALYCPLLFPLLLLKPHYRRLSSLRPFRLMFSCFGFVSNLTPVSFPFLPLFTPRAFSSNPVLGVLRKDFYVALFSFPITPPYMFLRIIFPPVTRPFLPYRFPLPVLPGMVFGLTRNWRPPPSPSR